MRDQNHYVSDKTLAARYDVSRSTIWRWSHIGQLPKPVKIFGSTRWAISEIERSEKELPLQLS
jgi:prophage regulatory protein